jgi:hypothetical protein
MPKYVIERKIPGFGQSSPQQLKAGAQKSNDVIEGMSHKVQWLHTYVIGDGTYCVYIAPDKEAIMEHGCLSGFPVDRIKEIKTIIDPTTGE